MINFIWVVWWINQWFIFMILLNFIISLLNQSYEKVMNSATKITYSLRAGLNQEAYVIRKKLGFYKENMSMFLLTANSESSENGDDEWQGYIKSVKNFVFAENAILLANICELLKFKETPIASEHNAETMKASIEGARLDIVGCM
jgi:hypothetical protein